MSKFLAPFVNLLFILLLVSSANSQTSSYAGQYKGEWTAAPFLTTDNEEHTEIWDISIDSDGEITGTETDQTTSLYIFLIKNFALQLS
jgi:hypothetical protein